MFEEALELITRLLSTENVSYQGRYWTLPGPPPYHARSPNPGPSSGGRRPPYRRWPGPLSVASKSLPGARQQRGPRHQQLVSVSGRRRGRQSEAGLRSDYQSGRVRLGRRSRRQGHAPPCRLAYPHARGLSSNSLPVNAGRAMTELTAQVAQQDDPAFLYKDWFFGTPRLWGRRSTA